MSEATVEPPKPAPVAAKPTPLTQTPRRQPLVPGPAPQTTAGPALPGVHPPNNPTEKHHVIRRSRGTIASVTDAIQKTDLPAEDRAYLVAKVQGLKANAVNVDLHLFTTTATDGQAKWTIHGHIHGLF